MEIIFAIAVIVFVAVAINKYITEKRNRELEAEKQQLETSALRKLGFSSWEIIPYYDAHVIVKSRQTLEKYDDIKFFKEDNNRLSRARRTIEHKKLIAGTLQNFLQDNEYKTHPQYPHLANQINASLQNTRSYRVCVEYVSSAGNHLGTKTISLNDRDLYKFENDPSLLMNKGEYTRYCKEKQAKELNQKHCEFYGRVNSIIDFANRNKDQIFLKGDPKQLDALVAQLFDRTVNSIKKIKTIDSQEWDIIENFINQQQIAIERIVENNQRILAYYLSPDFMKIKEACETLMRSQREFNEYISEKVQAISKLFGTRVIRNETIHDDENAYIRAYQKTITPFTAEVSAAVFASAENSPLEYVMKYFYPDKNMYPEQIQKLRLLLEELQTLKEAQLIIENSKVAYQQYLWDVPDYIIKADESGFYSRLGFAHIDEEVLTVEYKFSYTSNGGMAQRSFTVPMTEETIADLIVALENKMSASSFAKEQRMMMTKKLRDYIKKRDSFTCCKCKNSTHVEPNLLLEIDHIVPIAKGGCTVEENLQTLCWKCNRAKGAKFIFQ